MPRQIVVCTRERPVLTAGMVGMLKHEPVEHPAVRPGHASPSRAFEHCLSDPHPWFALWRMGELFEPRILHCESTSGRAKAGARGPVPRRFQGLAFGKAGCTT